jgi:hypothetical protein
MRLQLVCAQCMREDVSSAGIVTSIEFRDDGRYEVACEKGHRALTILQQLKFEILFDIGAYAILDGYYREAVSSFTSSLERFYEFFIKAVLRQIEIDEEGLATAWRLVAGQSERQLGAFALLYVREFGRAPSLLTNAKVSFRNDVIHKGRIPKRQEAIDYGQAVLDIVRPILRETKEKYPQGVEKSVFQHLRDCRGAADDGQAVATMAIPTILSLSVAEPGHDQRPMDQVLAALRPWV